MECVVGCSGQVATTLSRLMHDFHHYVASRAVLAADVPAVAGKPEVLKGQGRGAAVKLAATFLDRPLPLDHHPKLLDFPTLGKIRAYSLGHCDNAEGRRNSSDPEDLAQDLDRQSR